MVDVTQFIIIVITVITIKAVTAEVKKAHCVGSRSQVMCRGSLVVPWNTFTIETIAFSIEFPSGEDPLAFIIVSANRSATIVIMLIIIFN